MKLFFSGLLALCCVPAVVAQEAVDTERREAECAYVRDQLAKNWYVEAGAGAQVLFADDASGLGFGQRLTPSLSVAAGKWFSPYWGMRLQARGYGFNGNTGMGGIYVADPVDGLVQIPCIERNALAASRALDCATYALMSDGDNRVSYDDVLATMMQTGLDMNNDYRETSRGGLAHFFKEKVLRIKGDNK